MFKQCYRLRSKGNYLFYILLEFAEWIKFIKFALWNKINLNRRVMNGERPKRGDYNIFWTREQLAQWWEEEKGIVPPEPKIRRQVPKPTREERERLRKLESSK